MMPEQQLPDYSGVQTAPPAQYRMQTTAALLVMVLVPALCIAGNQAGLLRIVFPVLSLVVSAFLLWRSKPLYVGLVCWLWFVTPFLDRMADYQAGWTLENPVELAPYFAAAIAGLTLLMRLHDLGGRRTLPFICAFVAILYGLILGFVYIPLFNVLRAALNWFVPVIFGLFLYKNRSLYSQFCRAIEKAFLYGVLVTGIYGIYQFFNLPAWDRMWMLNVQMNSFGAVEAMKIRVFSTMNAPAIFAAVMACGLLLLANLKGRLRLLSAACGFLALILTLSRASWITLVVGFVYLMFRMGMRERMRLVSAAFVCGLFLLGLAQLPAIKDMVSQRVDTFADPNQDVSFSARIQGHEKAFGEISRQPFGEGLGSTDTFHNTEGDDDIIGPHDSTLLEILYSLGWIGSSIYALGLVLLGIRIMRNVRGDPFLTSSKAILVGLFAQCLLNSILIGILGFMVWIFASMCLARVDLAEEADRQQEREGYESSNLVAA
ncbi:MAG TPA: O-antigen ligase family protein [Terracidiphilus sp.]|nr:O-antigen ligase family protein [Terracidiphilus sp.]